MTIASATPDSHPDRRRFQFLDDYCPRCNPLGHHADSRVRLATLTEPEAVSWRGGRRVICAYRCDGCGHPWQRSDLWDAQSAGFDPKQRKDGAAA